MEKAVADNVAQQISVLARSHRILRSADLQLGEALCGRAICLAERLSSSAPSLIKALISEGRIDKRRIALALDADRLAKEFELPAQDIDPSVLHIRAHFALRRCGVEGKIVLGERQPEPDRTLLRALAQAHVWINDLRQGKPLGEIAGETGHSEFYIRTRAQLAFLSPAIQSEILEGRQPPDLTLERIIRKPIPLDWNVQAAAYGFA